MLALPLYLAFVGITIWGFFQPHLAGVIFVAAVAAFAGWLLAANWSLRSKWIRNLDPNSMSEEEIQVFRKHSLYFVFPFQAQQYSSTFSFIQMLSYVWLAVLLWHREWLLCGFVVGMFFVATNMAPYLNPGNFLRHHHARGKLPDFLLEKLAVVEAIEEKILGARRHA